MRWQLLWRCLWAWSVDLTTLIGIAEGKLGTKWLVTKPADFVKDASSNARLLDFNSVAVHSFVMFKTCLTEILSHRYFVEQRPDTLTVEDLKELHYLECVIKVSSAKLTKEKRKKSVEINNKTATWNRNFSGNQCSSTSANCLLIQFTNKKQENPAKTPWGREQH